MMPCIFHDWSEWKDTKIGDEIQASLNWPFPSIRQVIVQQKRCSRCNKVMTRRA
jgi:hypothetical protein